jgi:hypothetical protein
MAPEGTKAISAYWTDLAVAADEGNLYLNPVAAQACDSVCSSYIDKLIGHQRLARDLADVEGFGSLPSGIALATRFSEKAAGGPNNLVDVLQSHIDVVMAMQAVFRKFFTDTQDTDEQNASGIATQGPR